MTHILVTHTHTDHSPASRQLQERTGAPICGYGPQVRTEDTDPTRVLFGDPDVDPDPSRPPVRRGGDEMFRADIVLADRSITEGDGWTLESVHTPGHASNHLCYGLKEEGSLFTGDQVMGWATTVVAPPDGRLSEYLASLRKLLARRGDARYLPGHGPAIDQPHRLVRALISHRNDRNQQLLDLLERTSATISEIVPVVYANVSKQLWPAAAASVHAHVLHLEEAGIVEADDRQPILRTSRVQRIK